MLMDTDFQSIPVNGFLPAETIHAISQMAYEVLLSEPADDLALQFTIVHGYSQLIAAQPHELTYHRWLAQAATRMAALLRRAETGQAELADRLESVLEFGGAAMYSHGAVVALEATA